MNRLYSTSDCITMSAKQKKQITLILLFSFQMYSTVNINNCVLYFQGQQMLMSQMLYTQ